MNYYSHYYLLCVDCKEQSIKSATVKLIPNLFHLLASATKKAKSIFDQQDLNSRTANGSNPAAENQNKKSASENNTDDQSIKSQENGSFDARDSSSQNGANDLRDSKKHEAGDDAGTQSLMILNALLRLLPISEVLLLTVF